MSNIELSDELRHARARSDVDALQRVLAEYYEWHGAFARKQAGEEVDDSDLAIDPILDMARTATNVAGQALVPTIVAKRNGILDEDVYNGRVSTGSATEPALV